jgi:hypothetical protein
MIRPYHRIGGLWRSIASATRRSPEQRGFAREHLASVPLTAIGCYDRRRPYRAEPRVGRDLQPPTEGLSRWPNSPKP